MSSKKYDQSIHLQPHSSRYLSLALLVLHGIALVVAANLTVPGWLSVVISVVILVNFYNTFTVHVMGRGKYALLSMVWGNDGDWQMINGLGQELRGRLLPSSYVHPFLVVLNFRIEEGGRRTAILLRDSLDTKTFRNLLVRMRTESD